MTHATRRPLLSVITPVFNEQDACRSCAESLASVMRDQLPEYEYEHIFADNASTDETLDVLRDMAAGDRRIKVISNSRNVGPFRNAANAMKSARGDAVVPMLAVDLQDPVSVIPEFVANWRSGFKIVYGIRSNRHEGLLLRAARGSYYRILTWSGGASGSPAHAGEFLLIDRQVVESILSIDDQYPYIRGLVAQTGAKSTSVRYDWARRTSGRSKNSLPQLVDQAVNGFVTTARAPSRIALLLGLAASIFGILFGLVSLLWLAFTRNGTAAGIPTLIVGVFVLGGLQLFFVGLIGEYVLSIHGQVRRAPAMFEVERINLE